MATVKQVEFPLAGPASQSKYSSVLKQEERNEDDRKQYRCHKDPWAPKSIGLM